MRYRETNGCKLSVIGVGTWQFGSKGWGYGEGYAHHQAGEIATRAIELGVTLFDTAELYGFGRSEQILGAAIAPSRDKVVVASKYFPIIPIPGRGRAHAYASRSRLGVETIDLYQLHFPNPVLPLQMQAREFEPLIANGTIGHLGVSNYSLAAWRSSEQATRIPLVTNQVHLSLLARRSLREMVPWATANDRLVIAYSPLEQGLLGGKYTIDRRPNNFRRFRSGFSDRSLLALAPLVTLLRSVAANHDATVSQVALAWVISQPSVVAIPGVSSVEQLEQNVAAAELELELDEIAEITAVAQEQFPMR
ncbi:MAG: aldo/keto reductase [Ferrimicrobium sp.]